MLALEPLAVALQRDALDNLALQRVVRGLWKGYAEATTAELEVPVASLLPLTESYEKPRLLAAEALFDLYGRRGMRPFEPCLAWDELGYKVLLPPVCEDHSGAHLLVDGVHRVLAARRAGVQKLTVIRLTEVAAPPPRGATSWETLREYSRPRTLDEVMGAYSQALFRPVAAGLSRLTFQTRSQALAAVREW